MFSKIILLICIKDFIILTFYLFQKKNKTSEIWPLKDISCGWRPSNLVEEINSESSSDEDDDWIAFM